LIRSDDGKLQSKEEVLNEAALFGHIDLYPLPILTRMFHEHKTNGPSASQIAGGAYRRTVLERIIPYYARPRSLMAMLRGTLIHAGLQETDMSDNTKVIAEKRYHAQVPGTDFTISGQVDVYYPEHRRLEDYKTCQRIPSVIKEAHVFQLAVYYWLLVWNNVPVERAVIDYVSWDDVAQLSLAELPDDSIGDIMNHPIFKDESLFIDAVNSVWHILNDGFEFNYVPSMSDCNLSYCRYCPVKWACDRMPSDGGPVDPEDYVQEKGDM